MKTHNLEIEFKYNAAEICFEDFSKFCRDQNPVKVVHASGYDHFYASTKDPESFARHRIGPDFNQLTFKRKHTKANSYVRTEHNINLDLSVAKAQTKDLCAEFGYVYNTSIFKNVFVYAFDRHTFVYYVVYDQRLKELGRFVEIEMREDYPWKDTDEAMAELIKLEAALKPFGVTPQARIKRSLYEMFRKG